MNEVLQALITAIATVAGIWIKAKYESARRKAKRRDARKQIM